MNGVNKVILVGNLGLDPEFRKLDNGVSKARLRLATTETYRNSAGERIDKTEWHTVILWRGLADLAEKYLKKGARIYIEGKLRNRQIDTADNVKKTITEVEAENLVMLDRRQDSQKGHHEENPHTSSETSAYSSPNFEDLGNDDNENTKLPF